MSLKRKAEVATDAQDERPPKGELVISLETFFLSPSVECSADDNDNQQE